MWLPPELLFIVKAQRRLKLDERQVRSPLSEQNVINLGGDEGSKTC